MTSTSRIGSCRAVFASLALTMLLVSGSALAATEGAGQLPAANIVRIVLGTIVAVAVLLLTARLLPRLGGGHGVASDALRIVASLAVGQRERVIVVQVGDEQVMLGVAPGRVDMIHTLAEPLPARGANAVASRSLLAQTWLTRVMGKAS